MRTHIAQTLVVAAIAASLLVLPGCTAEEPDVPVATPAAQETDQGSAVAPAGAAEDAVDELNDKIDESTEGPE